MVNFKRISELAKTILLNAKVDSKNEKFAFGDENHRLSIRKLDSLAFVTFEHYSKPSVEIVFRTEKMEPSKIILENVTTNEHVEELVVLLENKAIEILGEKK